MLKNAPDCPDTLVMTEIREPCFFTYGLDLNYRALVSSLTVRTDLKWSGPELLKVKSGFTLQQCLWLRIRPEKKHATYKDNQEHKTKTQDT